MILSIVICTYNRADALIKCLNSVVVALNKALPVNAEVVVVNNASTDDTLSALQKWTEQNPDISLNVVTEERKGIAFARNCSFKTAKGDLLISIDDDCVLDENHIKNALAYYQNDKEPVLRFGRLDLGDPADWPMTIHTSPHRKQWKNEAEYESISMGHVCSANMMIPREIIAAVGFYDDRFGIRQIPGGEDADFGFRAYHKGYLLEYVPDVIAKHFHGRKDIDVVERLIKNYSIAAGALYGKHLFKHPHIARKLFPKSKNMQVNKKDPPSEDTRLLKLRELHKKAKKYYLLGILMFYWITTKRMLNFK